MWFFFDLSPSPSLSLSLCLPLVPLLLPPSLTNRLRRDVAQTKRDNSVRVLSFPVFSFFFTLALFFSFDYARPLLFALRERHRAALSRGWGCAGCAVLPIALCLWNRYIYIRVVPRGYRGLRGFQDDCRLCSITPCPFMEMLRDAFVTGDTCPG